MLLELAVASSFWAQAQSVAVSTSSTDVFKAVDPGRQKILVELWQRRIIDRGVGDWEPQDMSLLGRMREAESLGAFDLLKEKLGTLRGLVAAYGDERPRRLWLTKEGYNRYVFLLSQDALKYFETKGTDAKFVFGLRDMEGKKLFDGNGTLTPAGETVYYLILRGRAVEWRQPNGAVLFNKKPKVPAALPAPWATKDGSSNNK